MDHDDHAQRMYQQHIERGQGAIQNHAFPASTIAARFRHPSSAQSSSAEVSPTFGGPSQGYMEPGSFSGSSLSSAFQYPQFTAAEPVSYASQSHHPAPSYGQSYFYGTQHATATADTPSHDRFSRYEGAGVRNPSIASSSSQYSVPHTPQSQYFGSNQGSSFSATRLGDAGSQSGSTSFESMQYSQPGYSAGYQTQGQMLPPSSFSGYAAAAAQRQTVPSVTDVDEAYETYQTKAKEIFTLVRDGQLRETHDLLMYISQYLLGNAEGLGLDKDDKQLYAERLKLWDMFNNTWLTTLQAQFDNTREMIDHPSQPLQHSRTLLSVEDMEAMGHELVRLCDMIAHYGLVDYQMGVEEERILELLIRCIDLIAPAPADTPRTTSMQLPQSAMGGPSR